MFNHFYRYRIWDEDIGGYVNEEVYNGFEYLLKDVQRDIDSYCSDFPDDMEQDPIEKYDETFWAPRLIFDTLREFKFHGGLFEWTCWFPGHHRKIIVSFETQKN